MTRGINQVGPRSLLAPIAALASCAFLWVALLTFNVGDWPSPDQFPHNHPSANACGLVGAWASYRLLHLLGDGAYPLVLFLTLAAVFRLVRGQIGSVWERVFGLGLVVACTSASVHLMFAGGPRSLPVGHGGLVGFALGDLLNHNFSRAGTIIVLVSSWIVGLIFTTQGWVLKLPAVFGRAAQASAEAISVVRQLTRVATLREALPAGGAVLVNSPPTPEPRALARADLPPSSRRGSRSARDAAEEAESDSIPARADDESVDRPVPI